MKNNYDLSDTVQWLDSSISILTELIKKKDMSRHIKTFNENLVYATLQEYGYYWEDIIFHPEGKKGVSVEIKGGELISLEAQVEIKNKYYPDCIGKCIDGKYKLILT